MGWGTGLVVGPTGIIYVVMNDSAVRAVDATGADLWTWQSGPYAAFAPAVAPDGRELVLTSNSRGIGMMSCRRSPNRPPTD